jgi:hypothetical protein
MVFESYTVSTAAASAYFFDPHIFSIRAEYQRIEKIYIVEHPVEEA